MRYGCLLLVLTVAFSIPASASAQGPGRYCERQSELCWHCADIVFPAEAPCAAPACADGELCVDHEGDTCLAPLQFCCESGPCEEPPGCEGAGSACADQEGDGMNDRCTFLNECPPGGTPVGMMDAGATDTGAMDVGAADTGPLDAGGTDSGPVDAGAADAPKSDVGIPPITADGGCSCSASAPSTPLPLFALVLLVVVGHLRRRS